MKAKSAHPHKVVVIVGATSSGKTGLSIELARKFNGEVISADSRQVYRGFDIGSGKVTKKEMRGIPHHLLDVANPKKRFTAADFKRLGEKALVDIWSRGKLPIIAGGTGFYIDALLGEASLPQIPPDEKLREKLEKKTSSQLFVQLQKLDPKRATDLQKKNEHNLKRRLIRSIELTHYQGSSLILQPPHLTEDSPWSGEEVLWIGLRWSDEDLRKRIHDRLLARMQQGLVAEVKNLHTKGLSWKRMEELGLEYRYVSRCIRDKITKEEMLEQLETKIWQYARRQRTWFRRNEEIRWFEVNEMKKIENLVKAFLHK